MGCNMDDAKKTRYTDSCAQSTNTCSLIRVFSINISKRLANIVKKNYTLVFHLFNNACDKLCWADLWAGVHKIVSQFDWQTPKKQDRERENAFFCFGSPFSITNGWLRAFMTNQLTHVSIVYTMHEHQSGLRIAFQIVVNPNKAKKRSIVTLFIIQLETIGHCVASKKSSTGTTTKIRSKMRKTKTDHRPWNVFFFLLLFCSFQIDALFNLLIRTTTKSHSALTQRRWHLHVMSTTVQSHLSDC